MQQTVACVWSSLEAAGPRRRGGSADDILSFSPSLLRQIYRGRSLPDLRCPTDTDFIRSEKFAMVNKTVIIR